MKTTLLLIFTFLSVFVHAQCTESATSFGNNTSTTSYNVSGDVTITLNTNNTVTLNLASNFSTASGPDVRAYLVNSEGKTSAEIKAIGKNMSDALIYNDDTLVDNFQFGLINASGAQDHTATIPSGKNISDYDTVFFFCLNFGVFWDFGTYDSFNETNCAVLGVEDRESINKITISPNPASGNIRLSNIDANSGEIRIFNILGKEVYQQHKNLNKSINVSHLNAGVYILKVDIDGQIKTQKLVIQ